MQLLRNQLILRLQLGSKKIVIFLRPDPDTYPFCMEVRFRIVDIFPCNKPFLPFLSTDNSSKADRCRQYFPSHKKRQQILEAYSKIR